MIIKAIPLYPMGANCYILCEEVSHIGAVIDIGEYNAGVENAINEADIKELKYILCTHGHVDHITGVSDLKKHYPDAQIVIGELDAPKTSDAELCLANAFGIPFKEFYPDKTVSGGDTLKLGNAEITVIDAPGHSGGGVMYKIDKEKVIFSGDTLFSGSVGRTDFYDGNYETLINTLKIFKNLPYDYTVYCGHGESTTVGREVKNNYYLR
ncbi:MAG: MBL fold metallo-hydrolase [Acutalibacteraceae bacterium]